MSDVYAPEAAAEEAAEMVQDIPKAVQNGAALSMPSFDTGLPESLRMMAEKAVAQTRETYEKAKDTMEETVQAIERSFDAYGQGASAFQQKLMEIAQTNMNSGFDFVKKLAEAKDLAEIASLQSEFLRYQMTAFSNQAGQIRALSSKVAEDTAEPIKSQFARSFEKFPLSA
jgi:phasin